MLDENDLETKLTSILHKSAKVLNLQNYTVNINLKEITGDGFLSTFFKVSITDNDTNNEIRLAIKNAPSHQRQRKDLHLEEAFKNEIIFYSKILPALQFEFVPGYITSDDTQGQEIIVLKDITFDGYQMRDKMLLLDHEHTCLVFQVYGLLHGSSSFLRANNLKLFDHLTKDLVGMWAKINQGYSFSIYLSRVLEEAYDCLDQDGDGDARIKFKKYLTSTRDVFAEALEYDGDYPMILHGDCWSNNMMFKYQKERVVGVKLLDFQLVRVGSPIFDLSYFFYTGCGKELFDKLDLYLDIYHDSLTKAGKDVIPRERLSDEWKKYARLGMILSLMLTRQKLAQADRALKKELLTERTRDIIRHVYNMNAL